MDFKTQFLEDFTFNKCFCNFWYFWGINYQFELGNKLFYGHFLKRKIIFELYGNIII